MLNKRNKLNVLSPLVINKPRNGRLMFFCTCAECGIKKTKFVKSKTTGGIKKTTKKKTINNLN